MRTGMLAAVVLALVAACGSVATAPATDAGPHRDAAVDDTGTHRDAARDATRDSPTFPPPADGPFACGTSTCAAAQFCLVPCVDVVFPAPSCAPAGTICPEGSMATGTSCDGGMMCSFGPAPPQPSCVDMPPCTPDTNFCEVQGRTYTETGCA
jgi:hypothetical protein